MAQDIADLRIGMGIDVHPFTEGRPLVLGGERIPYHLGLAGHSDADVLLHALADALLGGSSLGDIGQHFPDSDPAQRNRSSLEILREVTDMVQREGLRVLHVDTAVIAERPRLSPHYAAMRRNIAGALGIPESRVGLKATTTEALGFAGRGEGIAAQAVCLLAPWPREEDVS